MTIEPYYVMDICSTCGRPAAWPYCEHRHDGYPMDQDARSWTEAIVVKPATPRGREARAALGDDGQRPHRLDRAGGRLMTDSDRFAQELDADAPMAWRPDEGEKLVGKVLSIVERISSYDGETPYPVLEVLDEASGKVLQVHVFHEVLLGKLMEQQPKIGERVGIKYIRKGEKYHEYVFRVDRPDGSTAPVDWARYSSDARDNPGQPVPSSATQAAPGDFAAPAAAREPITDGAAAPVAADLITPEQYEQVLEAFQAAGSPVAPLTAWLDATHGPSTDNIATRVAALRTEQGTHLLTWLRDR